MNSQHNEPEMRIVGVLLVTVVLLAVSFVVGLGINKAQPKGEPPLPMTLASLPEQVPEPINEARVVVAPSIVKFYFASGKADLAAGAQEALSTVVLAAKAGQQLTISGFHDITGDPTMNAELAKQRALSVRAALLTAGVADASLNIKQPEQMPNDANLAEARRVDVVIQP
jgi:outer membrane protein OmpA-like peptidoglycan-associated protein